MPFLIAKQSGRFKLIITLDQILPPQKPTILDKNTFKHSRDGKRFSIETYVNNLRNRQIKIQRQILG